MLDLASGRYPIFLANLPHNIPAKFVDQQCGCTVAGIQIGFMETATGNRPVGSLARILQLKGARFGRANTCVGGGQAIATIIEREEYDC